MATHSSILVWTIPWTEGCKELNKTQNACTSSGGTSGKEPACQFRRTLQTQVRSLGWEDPLEEGTATHYSILAWRIPWTEEPGGPQFMES